jgi:hypothetical protein
MYVVTASWLPVNATPVAITFLLASFRPPLRGKAIAFAVYFAFSVLRSRQVNRKQEGLAFTWQDSFFDLTPNCPGSPGRR